jgi:hypothetical protein
VQTYAILLVFEEYDILTRKRGVFGASLEDSSILRLILPHSLDNISVQNDSMAKRYIETDKFCVSSSLDFTDGGRAIDKRFARSQQPGVDAQALRHSLTTKDNDPTTPVNGGQAMTRGVSEKVSKVNDFKIFANFKNALPFKDEPRKNFEEYCTQKQ